MAKGKNSTALFEVINATRKAQAAAKGAAPLRGPVKSPAASLLRSGAGWFKSRPVPEAQPADDAPHDPNDPTAYVSASNLMSRRPPVATSQPFVSDEPEPHDVDASEVRGGATVPCGVDESTAPVPQYPTIRLHPNQTVEKPATPLVAPRQRPTPVDREAGTFTLQMRRPVALISAFALVASLIGAYILGHHLGESGARADMGSLASTRQVRAGATQNGVLDVGHSNAARLASGKIDHSAEYQDADLNSSGIAMRMNNLNYLIIATFPPEKRDQAIKACDFLCEHGVTCTLDRGLHGVPPTWLCIVGVRGFAPRFADNIEYKNYRNAIIALSEKFPARSSFSKFSPWPYKWDLN